MQLSPAQANCCDIPVYHLPPCSCLMEDGYLEQSGADHMIRAMMEELRMRRPTKPAEFMVQFLQDNYIKKKIRRLYETSIEDEMAVEEDELSELSELSSPELLSSPEFERPNVYIVVPDSLKRKRRGMLLLPFLTLCHACISLLYAFTTPTLNT